MSQIVLYFLHSTSILPFYIDGVLTLSIWLLVFETWYPLQKWSVSSQSKSWKMLYCSCVKQGPDKATTLHTSKLSVQLPRHVPHCYLTRYDPINRLWKVTQGARFVCDDVLSFKLWIASIGIPIINLRRSSDRLRFIMGIPIPVRRLLLGE